jgi:hypothetical protein
MANAADRYDTYIKQAQNYMRAAQAKDPAFQAWQAEASRYSADMGGAPAWEGKDYFTEWFKTLPPEQQRDYEVTYQEAQAQKAKSFTGRLGSLAKIIPGVVIGAGALSAFGVIGAAADGAAAVAGAAEGAAAGAAAGDLASAALPLWDTGVGGLFGSQAAVDAALTGAGWYAPATVGGGVAAAASAGFDFSTAAAAAGGAGGGGGAGKSMIDSVTGLVKNLGGAGGLLNAGLGIAGAVTAAQGAKDQAEEEQATAEFNAREAELAARNALQRGEEEARDLRRKGSLIEGMQRATYASRGVSLNMGSPREAVEQTGLFTRQDMATARSNAATEAATYRRQGKRFSSQASSINPSKTAGLSLVGNLSSVAAKWYDRYSAFQP